MNQLSLQLPNSVISPIKNLLKQRLKDKNNLIYYASGKRIRDGYNELHYDNIVLVDKCFKEAVSIKGKIICIGLDAVQATALFKEIGVKFEAFVCINEGLSEGGGHYPINGNWSLSNILPIMHDEYVHIACPDYYGQRKWIKMANLPQTTIELNEGDSDYIDPRIFSDYHKSGKKFYIWKVTKQPGSPVSFQCGNRNITVERKNAWDDYDVLDSLFIRCSPCEERNLKNVAPKAEIVKNYSFEQILQYCNRNKIVKVGFMPWLSGHYEKFLQYLEANQTAYPKELYFFHLQKNDYKQLYSRAEQQRTV
jgi:hypothetical protein